MRISLLCCVMWQSAKHPTQYAQAHATTLMTVMPGFHHSVAVLPLSFHRSRYPLPFPYIVAVAVLYIYALARRRR